MIPPLENCNQCSASCCAHWKEFLLIGLGCGLLLGVALCCSVFFCCRFCRKCKRGPGEEVKDVHFEDSKDAPALTAIPRPASVSVLSVSSDTEGEASAPKPKTYFQNPDAEWSEVLNSHGAATNQQRLSNVTLDAYAGLLNDVLKELWPEISGVVTSVLRDIVEPALQAAVPSSLSGIHFDKLKCHLGDRPVQMHKLKTKVDTRYSAEHGAFKCIRIVGDIVLNSDCEIEVKVPQGFHIVQVDLTAGVSNVKVHGRIVLELYQCVPQLPLISGLRIYFPNAPSLDAEMTGHFSDVLNASFIKNKILDVVSQVIRNRIVLPARISIPIAHDVNIMAMGTPRPEGMMRVMVLEARGLGSMHRTDAMCGMASALDDVQAAVRDQLEHWGGDTGAELYQALSKSHKFYIVFDFGNEICQTKPRELDSEGSMAWTDSNVLDLTVHDRHSQWLVASIYRQHHKIKAAFSDGAEFVGQCGIPVKGLLRESSFSTGSWWPLTEKKILVESTSPVTKEVAAMNLTPCIRLNAEWRPFVRSMQLGAEWPNPQGSWRFQREDTSEKDVDSILIVSVAGASDLPEEGTAYWCSVTCTNTPPLSFQGQPTGASKNTVTARVPAESCVPTGTRKSSQVMQSVRSLGADSHTGFNIVVWGESFTFHVHTPQTAIVKLTLYEEQVVDNSGKNSERVIGTQDYDVAELLADEGLQVKYKDAVHVPTEIHLDKIPICEVKLKMWMLGESSDSKKFTL